MIKLKIPHLALNNNHSLTHLRCYHTLQVKFDLEVCLNISTVINIKILTNSNQQTQSYKFTSHIAAFLSVVLITEMLEICIQTSYDQNVQLILKSYLSVVYGTPFKIQLSTKSPLTVYALLLLLKTFEIPKSPILTTSFRLSSNIFCVLRSLCKICLECTCCSDSNICAKYFKISYNI
jgi:hypothetical protein